MTTPTSPIDELMTQREPGHRPGRHHPRRGRARSCTSTGSRSCRWSTTRATLKGLITVKDIQKKIQFPNATKDARGRLRVGAAVGVGRMPSERVARADRGRRRRVCRRHRPRPLARRDRDGAADQGRASPIDVVAGNVATAEGDPRPDRGRGRRHQGRHRARARSARPASSPASACRRSPPSTTAPRRPRGTACRSSPTAASSTRATSPRPSPPGPTR